METLVALDQRLTMSLNGLVGQSGALDMALYGITTLNLTKFVPVYALLWGLWFQRSGHQEKDREAITLVFVSVFFTMLVSRLLQNFMPPRPRPIHDAAIGFRPPDALGPDVLEGWSSFPSDHAGVAFALGVGILFVSVRWGIVALLWAALVICFPRIYSGLHYFGDIAVGAVVGIVITLVVMRLGLPSVLRRLPARLEAAYPLYFYAVAFVVTYLFATLMDDLRIIGEALLS